MSARVAAVRFLAGAAAAVLCAVALVAGGAAGARAAACTDPDQIARHYCELGGTSSVLGAPVGAPRAVAGGRVQDYTNGSIYWSAATGAHEVHGAIVGHYRQLGGPAGTPSLVLGFPLTDETGTPDGVGRFNHFTGGSVYWTPSTGAHEVHGAIRARWEALGWERGRLGYPVTDESRTPDGVGRFNHFTGGSIYWTPSTGAHEVHGAIRARWEALGWERGLLGYPITDEYGVTGGRESDFQGGFLRWTSSTGVVRLALLAPYEHAGTWVTRFAFSREFGGPTPPTTPAEVDTMAARGVHTLYLQAAADDPRYPGLLSPDLLGEFLVRAHVDGMQVVAWYLPHVTDVPADLARLQAMAAFRADGEAFDAVAVDIEDRSVADVDARNAALVDLSTRLHAALPGTTLGAIVLPPVVTDVLNPAYWPRFPWHQLAPLYQVWLPMAYWTNRTDPVYSDPDRYVDENVVRLRGDLGEPCAAVSVIGGYGGAVPPSDHAAMATAAARRGAVGVSVFDWATTPPSAWPPLVSYAVRGC